MMKQGGDSEVPKSPPYYRIIYSDEGVIPQLLPAPLFLVPQNKRVCGFL